MKIAIMGTGYVGLTLGVCLADMGHDVTCVDVNKEKVDMLKKGETPIFEPGLTDMLRRNIKEKRIYFTTNAGEGIKKSHLVFIAVGTPQSEDGSADLSYVKKAAETIAENIDDYTLIVTKSTVPVGTAKLVKSIVKKKLKEDGKSAEFDVASNPEFLREGFAIKDFMNPDRIVIGADSERARSRLYELYKPLERADKPILITDTSSAELIKYASNAFLATKISFINELSRLCEKVGADIKTVSRGMGLDDRIGPRFLQAGAGYGGSCFPKDVRALIKMGEDNGVEMKIVGSAHLVNLSQRELIFKKVNDALKGVSGRTITVWGLAFKPNTDDTRESPSIYIIKKLLLEGAVINAFDPQAAENARRELDGEVNYFNEPYEALRKADCLLLMTEWDEFRTLNYDKLRELMNTHVIVDARNIYQKEEVISKGIKYVGVGR